MHKAQVTKLQREVDEERNKIKSKKDMLEGLKIELEQLRILSGCIPKSDEDEKPNKTENSDDEKPESPVQEKVPIKLSGKV